MIRIEAKQLLVMVDDVPPQRWEFEHRGHWQFSSHANVLQAADMLEEVLSWINDNTRVERIGGNVAVRQAESECVVREVEDKPAGIVKADGIECADDSRRFGDGQDSTEQVADVSGGFGSRRSTPVQGIIYKLTNKLDGKIYVGQTTKTIWERFRAHRNANSPLGRAIRQDGEENFILEVLEKCQTRKELDTREMYWIKQLDCLVPNGYNQHPGFEEW